LPQSDAGYPTPWCVFDLGKKERLIAELEREARAPSFWDDNEHAQRSMRNLSSLREEVGLWRGLEGQAKSIDELIELALDERDETLGDTLAEEILELTKQVDSQEFKLALSGEYDQRNAIVAIHAGAGGVESQDWARMLMRMYLRWVERRGFESEVLDVSPGEEAGVKSAMLQVSGEYAYGYLKAERGVHRLVRISPFDADHARHTSFALAEVLPEAEEGVDVTIDPADIKLEVFKAGGAGGQSVQKNSTAVRITHLPTGIKASCQNERSQYQNKNIAMQILLARLVEREMKERAKEVARLKGEHISPEWGHQIRSYVLQPYKMVKDHRTKFETSDADSVLDGDLDGLINSYLATTIGE
jgi:peptide chain release factor 2